MMISRTPRVALAGIALVLTMAACASTDADDAVTDDAVTTEADATVSTTPTGTEPGPDSTDAAAEPETSESATGSARADTTAPPEPEPVAVPEALQFSAPLVGGGQFDGGAVAGKPTLFWFWAPT